MLEKFLTCATCPKECTLKITINGDKLELVTGNGCKRGVTYAENELYHPERVLTTTVLVEKGKQLILPVRSNVPIPKKLLLDAMKIINMVTVSAPINRGDIVVENVLNSGINIVASKTITAV